MLRPVQRLAAWLCLLVASVEAAATGRVLVLCIEADGAVNIESLAGELCCGDAEDLATEGSVAEPTSCPCVDVAVEFNSERADPRRDTIGSPAAMPPSFEPLLAASVAAAFAPKARSLPAQSTAPRLVGTVVLRA